MKEQEVYVKADEVSNFALIEYSDDVWSRTSSYLKPTTGILLIKEELVKLMKECFIEGSGEGSLKENKELFNELLKEKGLL